MLAKARYIKRTVWRSVCPYGTCSVMAESDWATQRPYATAKLACRDRPRRGVLFSRRSRQERSVPRAVLSASAAALIAHQPGSLPSGITLDILPSGGRPGFAPRSRGFVRERSWLSGVSLSGRAQRWPALGIERKYLCVGRAPWCGFFLQESVRRSFQPRLSSTVRPYAPLRGGRERDEVQDDQLFERRASDVARTVANTGANEVVIHEERSSNRRSRRFCSCPAAPI